jgi:hypothetical protein
MIWRHGSVSKAASGDHGTRRVAVAMYHGDRDCRAFTAALSSMAVRNAVVNASGRPSVGADSGSRGTNGSGLPRKLHAGRDALIPVSVPACIT